MVLWYFVCADQIQIAHAVWLRKMENLAMTFFYLWLREKLWLLGGKKVSTLYLVGEKG